MYLQTALDAIKTGMPVRKPAEAYKIPKSTLSDKNSKKVLEKKCTGGKVILNKKDEKDIIEQLFECSLQGFPMTKNNLLNAVQTYVKQTKYKIYSQMSDLDVIGTTHF